MVLCHSAPDSSGPRSGGRRLTPESKKRTPRRFLSWLIVWGPAVAWAAVLFLLSELRGVPVNVAFATNDKLVHFGLYAVLGSALGWAWYASRSVQPTPKYVPHAVAIGLGLIYGAVDELHQFLVPRRMPSVADWVADAIGVFVGYAVAVLVLQALFGRMTSQSRATKG